MASFKRTRTKKNNETDTILSVRPYLASLSLKMQSSMSKQQISDLGLGNIVPATAKACGTSHSTVQRCVRTAKQANNENAEPQSPVQKLR